MLFLADIPLQWFFPKNALYTAILRIFCTGTYTGIGTKSVSSMKMFWKVQKKNTLTFWWMPAVKLRFLVYSMHAGYHLDNQMSCMGQYVTTVLSRWDLGLKKPISLLLKERKKERQTDRKRERKKKERNKQTKQSDRKLVTNSRSSFWLEREKR